MQPNQSGQNNNSPTFIDYGYERPLDEFFNPSSVAVIGATENPGSVGRTLLENLTNSKFKGKVYPINKKHATVLGLQAYATIADVPDKIELAVIVTPAPTVLGIIKECVAAGVKGAIIISAGFKERGPEGLKLEQEILAEAQRGKMRILGPNCLGSMCPRHNFNATFAATIAKPGNVAFISQSGALCTAVLDWSLKENVGFSIFVSIGSLLDVGWGDLIDYLGDDPATKSVILYMENIGDARAFLSAAREVAFTKPIIVIKAGRTQAAARAAISHTGALTGSDEVLDAAFQRSAVLRVNTIAELFYMAELLSKQPRPTGPNLTIVTNAGGPGVLATDALISSGGELTQLSDETLTALNHFLPHHWSHANPIDIIGDADPERYAKTFEVVVKDPNTNGLLVIVTPQAMTNPTQTAELLKIYARVNNKAVFASLMGGDDIAEAEAILNQANIPTFPYPDTAARMFNYMWQYNYNLRSLYETPMLAANPNEEISRDTATKIIESVRQAGRTILTEVEAKEVLAAYGLPVTTTKIAVSEDEAVEIANQFGYPVVLKIFSHTITHKTDVNGVQLNLADAEAVRKAFNAIKTAVNEKVGAEHFQGVTVQPMVKVEGYELIIGSSIDDQFGPVLLFGGGGQLVEVYKDRTLALPPLTTTLARRMMEHTLIFQALQGVRGRAPVDIAALEQILVRFSQLVVEQPWIKEIDINPLIAAPDSLLILDARIVVHDQTVREENLPRAAIKPYPLQYVQPWTLRDGTPVIIRPIRPEDEPLMIKFHETLSDRSVYFRWLHPLKLSQRISHERLTRICFIDYDREMALVVDYTDPQSGERHILGVGRLTRLHGTNEAEFAVLISDKHQRTGLGSELLRRLLQVGRDMKLARVFGEIHPENIGMQQLSKKAGMRVRYSIEDQLVKAEIDL